MSEMEMGKGGFFETQEEVIERYIKAIKEEVEKEDVTKARELLNDVIILYNDPESKFLVKLCNELDKAFPLKCPELGTAFTAYKICEFADDINYRYALVELEIPSITYRSSAFGNKCRCVKAVVKSIRPFTILKDINYCRDLTIRFDKRIKFRSELGKIAYSIMSYLYGGKNKILEYEVGQEVVADAFDTFRWNECSNGIHFFMSEEETLDYALDYF